MNKDEHQLLTEELYKSITADRVGKIVELKKEQDRLNKKRVSEIQNLKELKAQLKDLKLRIKANKKSLKVTKTNLTSVNANLGILRNDLSYLNENYISSAKVYVKFARYQKKDKTI